MQSTYHAAMLSAHFLRKPHSMMTGLVMFGLRERSEGSPCACGRFFADRMTSQNAYFETIKDAPKYILIHRNLLGHILFSTDDRQQELFAQDSHGIRSNHQFLVGRNNHDLYFRIIGRNNGFFATYFVFLGV